MAILKANGIDIYFEESGNPAGEPVLLIMGFSMNAGAWGAQIDALKAKLKARVGSDVTIDAHVDPSILGGIVVRLGSQMIDASIATKLNTLATAMKG